MDPLAASPSQPAAPVSSSGAPTAAQGPGAARADIPSDFDTFLRMLTVQMRNQDPLDPIDSADYAVQLATFSGVEQQVRTNELLGSLADRLGLSGLAELAGWVGRDARAAMPARFEGAPVTVYPRTAPGAEAAELVVRDAQGQEVARHALPLGAEPIQWAGVTADGAPLPPGLYRFDVVSLARGEPVATAQAEVWGRVSEVRSEAGGAVLVIGGASVPASAVTGLRAG